MEGLGAADGHRLDILGGLAVILRLEGLGELVAEGVSLGTRLVGGSLGGLCGSVGGSQSGSKGC